MQLETKPKIYYRLNLLISKSKRFKKRVEQYNNELNEHKRNGFIPKDFQQETAEEINRTFSIGTGKEEKKVALEAITQYLSTGVDQRACVSFEESEIVLRIRTPITENEFTNLWGYEIERLQQNFIRGYNKDIVEFDKNLKGEKVRKFGNYKSRKGRQKRFTTLDEKRWQEQLTASEMAEYQKLRKEVEKMEPFKYPSGLSNIDEDLLILELYLKHGKSKTIANEEYKKIKLAEYLKNRDGEEHKFKQKDKFGDLVYKYITQEEIEKHHAKNVHSLIRAKDFDSRLRTIEKAYMA